MNLNLVFHFVRFLVGRGRLISHINPLTHDLAKAGASGDYYDRLVDVLVALEYWIDTWFEYQVSAPDQAAESGLPRLQTEVPQASARADVDYDVMWIATSRLWLAIEALKEYFPVFEKLLKTTEGLNAEAIIRCAKNAWQCWEKRGKHTDSGLVPAARGQRLVTARLLALVKRDLIRALPDDFAAEATPSAHRLLTRWKEDHDWPPAWITKRVTSSGN